MSNKTDQPEPEQNFKNLMISEQPFDDFNDFLNRSLSDVDYYQVNPYRAKSKEPPKQIIITTEGLSFPQSPETKLQNIVTSPSQHNLTNRPKRSDLRISNYTSLVQYFHVKTFINKLNWKKKINSLFNKYHFDVINDKAACFNLKLFRQNTLKIKPIFTPVFREESMMQKFQKNCRTKLIECYTRLSSTVNRIPVIWPESRQKLIWDGWVMIARLYFMFVIPLDLSVSQKQFMYQDWYPATLIMIANLICDLLLNLNSAYYEQGQIVVQRSRIALNVLQQSFGLELISIFLLMVGLWDDAFSRMDLQKNQYQFVLLIFIVHFKNIAKLIRQVEEALNLSKLVSSILELLKLTLGVMYLLHVFACLWLWVNHLIKYILSRLGIIATEIGRIVGWTINNKWMKPGMFSIYTPSTFQRQPCLLLVTGILFPKVFYSHLERIISIAFMMICSIQLSYSVSTVGAIIDKISQYRDNYMKKLQTINTFMQNKNISYKLQYQQSFVLFQYFQRIREYLNYYWKIENDEFEGQEEQNIIGQLSENLRERLMTEANSQMLKTCPLFNQFFSEPLKKKLVKKVSQVVIQPENVIDFSTILPNKQGSQQYLCFIERGEIEILIFNEQFNSVSQNMDVVSIVRKVGSGDMFGLNSFITGRPSPEKFRSVGFAKIQLLCRNDFLKILNDYPEDFEQFRYIHDKIVFDQNYDLQKMKCFSCSSYKHKALDCPLIHFIPDKEKIIKQVAFSRSQDRNENRSKKYYKRSPNRQLFSAFEDLDIVHEAAECFQNENGKWCKIYEQEEDQQDEDEEEEEWDYSNFITIDETELKKKNSKLYKQRTRVLEEQEPKPDLMMIANIANQKKQKKSVHFTSEDNLNNNSNNDEISKTKSIFKKKQNLDPIELDKQIEMMSKFKNAVRLVRNLNKVAKKKKSAKSQTRLIKTQSTIFQESQLEQMFQNQLLQNLELKMRRISKEKKVKLLDSEKEKIQFMILRLKMQSKTQVTDIYDALKEFKFYYPQNNLEVVLHKHYYYYIVQQQQVPGLSNLFTQFVQYCFYPQAYLAKYKYKRFDDEIEIEEDKHLGVSETLQTEENLIKKNRRKSVRQMIKKPPRKSQITPQAL